MGSPTARLAYSAIGLGVQECETLLGDAWKKMFPAGQEVSDLIPRKVAGLLRIALQKLANQLAEEPEKVKIIRSAAEELLGQADAKRLRFA